MYSNPCMADTDLDSYDDYVEEYIGTSPISVWNSLDTSGIISSSIPSGFSFNNWWDWQELIEEHAWNYIHNAVEEDIVTNTKEKSCQKSNLHLHMPKSQKSNWDWISIHQKHPHQTIMRFGEQ